MLHFLLVDDDPSLRLALRLSLEKREYRVSECASGEEAVAQVVDQDQYFDFVIFDVHMAGMSGIEALRLIKDHRPDMTCMVLTAYSEIKDAVEAVRSGAFDYVEKPIQEKRLFQIIDAALEAKQTADQAQNSSPQLMFEPNRSMIGDSQPIKRIFAIIDKLSKVDTSVLIQGESGTGKELVARALHQNSYRKKSPFVAVNCSAIPKDLFEAEIFGYEKGAFTGAAKASKGKLGMAQGGTPFLDEIGDMPPELQAKLLRFVQEKSFYPLGSDHEQQADVRVIGATSCDLEKKMVSGNFRSDLYYRLSILPIHLPPLRDRKEDIPKLCDYFIAKYNKKFKKALKGLNEKALAAFLKYPWPGNIRELENAIQHGFILETSSHISEKSIPPKILESQHRSDAPPGSEQETEMELKPVDQLDFNRRKENFERSFLIEALKKCKGKVNYTAEETNMNKVTLIRKLQKYQIDPNQYK